MGRKEVKVPDIGDFDQVPVIEVLVGAGDEVAAEDSLITLESDKATMEVPSPADGTIAEMKVSEGDQVSEGDVIAILETAQEADDADNGDSDSAESKPSNDADAGQQAEQQTESQSRSSDSNDGGEDNGSPDDQSSQASATDSASAEASSQEGAADSQPASGQAAAIPPGDYDCDVLVLGSGPGGYTAAFRAADLGLDTILVERYERLGGVCLNVGCIPSKALLHAAEVIAEAAAFADHGIRFGEPEIEAPALSDWKQGVVNKLTSGLAGMAKKRQVETVHGEGRFTAPHELSVTTGDGERRIRFRYAIIAAGSQAIKLDGMPWGDPRLMDSTDALMLQEIPETLLVIGGGIIGLEMACVYDALGSQVSVVEMTDQLMPGTDKDLVKPLHQRIAKRYGGIHLSTRVSSVKVDGDRLSVSFEGDNAPSDQRYSRVLVAVGRSPNGRHIGAENAGVQVSDRGFIPVDKQMRTNVPHIFAIGDIVGQPMLAHKATHEGKVAAEVCAGQRAAFDARVIPSVAYTDPEVAWVGATETELKDQGLQYEVGKFPWAASGRALALGRSEGFTKLLFDPKTDRIIGAGIVGPMAGDLIAECAMAIEMGAVAEDIGHTIHAHPTLSETVAFAAEAYAGTITDLYIPKRS